MCVYMGVVFIGSTIHTYRSIANVKERFTYIKKKRTQENNRKSKAFSHVARWSHDGVSGNIEREKKKRKNMTSINVCTVGSYIVENCARVTSSSEKVSFIDGLNCRGFAEIFPFRVTRKERVDTELSGIPGLPSKQYKPRLKHI